MICSIIPPERLTIHAYNWLPAFDLLSMHVSQASRKVMLILTLRAGCRRTGAVIAAGYTGTRCVIMSALAINAKDKAGCTPLLCVNRHLTLETQNRVIRSDMAVLRTFHTQRRRCRARRGFQRSEAQTREGRVRDPSVLQVFTASEHTGQEE